MKASGSINWYEIRVTDLDRATAFYTAVFDVVAWPWEQDGYAMLIDPLGAPIFALQHVLEAPPTDAYLRPTWDTADLELTLGTVHSAGGAAEQLRTKIDGGIGWWASARDPFGNYLGFSTSFEATA